MPGFRAYVKSSLKARGSSTCGSIVARGRIAWTNPPAYRVLPESARRKANLRFPALERRLLAPLQCVADAEGLWLSIGSFASATRALVDVNEIRVNDRR